MNQTNKLVLEELVELFEQNWNQENDSDLKQFLESLAASHSGVSYPLPIQWIRELVLVDLEWRLRMNQSETEKFTAKDYQTWLASYLCGEFITLGLLTEEYRIRTLFSANNAREFMLQTYGNTFPQLAESLLQCDRELQQEYGRTIQSPSQFMHQLCESHHNLRLIQYEDLTLKKHLGTGGMGKVYQAEIHGTNEVVAVKTLLKTRQEEIESVQRFLEEATLAAKLNHPAIASLIGIGSFGQSNYFLIYQYNCGTNLGDRSNDAVFDLPKLAITLCQALMHAHSRNVLHCDLKPQNILLDDSGHYFLTDFGFGQLMQSDSISHPGGTLSFMAPEQRGLIDEPLSPNTDIFGLGATLFHLATNQFANLNREQKWINTEESLQRHIEETLAKNGVNSKLKEVIQHSLDWSPNQRGTLSEIAAQLQK